MQPWIWKRCTKRIISHLQPRKYEWYYNKKTKNFAPKQFDGPKITPMEEFEPIRKQQRPNPVTQIELKQDEIEQDDIPDEEDDDWQEDCISNYPQDEDSLDEDFAL